MALASPFCSSAALPSMTSRISSMTGPPFLSFPDVETGRPGFDILGEERMGEAMKYLILIQSNPQSLAVWETLTDQQRTDLGVGHLRLSEEMREAGVLVVSEGLGDPALATQVSVRDGRTITSDGPYAEVKEHLAGFYLIDVADLDE